MTFHTTRWSVVLTAKDAAPTGRAALAELCETYWYPLYVLARSRGLDAEAAADGTQSFFVDLLDKRFVDAAHPARGRFRAFLRTAFVRHLGHARDRERTARRGGGAKLLSLDFADGERRYAHEPVDPTTPERRYDRRFALMLLARAHAGLREVQVAAGKEAHFAVLWPWVAGSADRSSKEDAERLGMTEGSFRVAVHRLRGAYRDLLRAEIADIVSSSDEIDEELASLRESLR